ncbi:MAG: hypothetical protein KA911_08310, partial [Xanthomonadales bacterium]|nr:hypothetical protein [Xanthomonadales bacterium]
MAKAGCERAANPPPSGICSVPRSRGFPARVSASPRRGSKARACGASQGRFVRAMLEPGQLLKAILGVAGAWFALGLLGL